MGLREQLSRTRLEYKILLILALSLTLGLGSYVIYTTQAETRALLKQSRQKSQLFAESLKAGIRNVMLSGRPSYVRSLIEETREEFRSMGRLRLFNNEAREIFSEKERYIAQLAEDSLIIEFLEHAEAPADDDRSYILLENETACQECHGDKHPLRGLVRMDMTPLNENAGESIGAIATQAFRSIMLSGKGARADELLIAIDRLAGVSRAQIYDKDGYYIAFGNDENEVPETILEAAVSNFASRESRASRYYSEKDYDTYIFPLENDEQCQVCHGSDHAIRGMFALSLERSDSSHISLAENMVIEGFKNMMLMERGMYVSNYVQGVRSLPFVNDLSVFDNGQKQAGGLHELYVPNPEFTEEAYSDSVNKLILTVNRQSDGSPRRMEYQEVLDDGITYLTQIIPLTNDEKCQACHEPPQKDDPLYHKYGDRWKVRSVLEVSTSLAEVQGEIRRNIYASIGVGIFTIILVGVILRIFIKIVVLTPLSIIGRTVGAVGDGNLAVSAKIPSGDEIGLLADRINQMIQGLRERLHLTKFVSRETVAAVQVADLDGVTLGGKRKEATVLFSDIRGFTAYSEKVDPESVISMLNSILNEQAQIVREHGGDIDKFVGDELMAVFQDAEMATRAIVCGIALQRRMIALSVERSEPITIGIGINTGSMVMGAMGSIDRMDFTVIGDNVNLGARLCSAAGPGQIIVSAQTIRSLGEDHPFQIEQLAPISVKGKQKPVTIFSVKIS